MLAWPALADDFPRAEVFGGYQHTRVGAVPGINVRHGVDVGRLNLEVAPCLPRPRPRITPVPCPRTL